MSDEPRRLLDEHSAGPLRAILEAGLRDQPSKRNLVRAARTLGIGAAGLGAAKSAAATAKAIQGLWPLLAKWGAVGLLIGGAALSPFVLRQQRTEDDRKRAEARSPATTVASLPAASSRPSADPPLQADPAAPTDLPVLAARPSLSPVRAPTATGSGARLRANDAVNTSPSTRSFEVLPNPAPPSAARLAPSAASSSELDSEVALLDAARQALKTSGPNAALVLLDRHSQFRAPSLGAEATLLRVQALVAAGRVSEAQGIARRALSGTSPSAYARRLSKLAGLEVPYPANRAPR